MFKNKHFVLSEIFLQRYGHLRMEPKTVSDFEEPLPSKVNDNSKKTVDEASYQINPTTCSLPACPLEVNEDRVSHPKETEADGVTDQMDIIHAETLQYITRSTSGTSEEKQVRKKGLSVEEHEMHIQKQKSFLSCALTAPEETSVHGVRHNSPNSIEALELSVENGEREIGEYLSRKLKVCPSGESIPQYPIDANVVVIEHGECSLERK